MQILRILLCVLQSSSYAVFISDVTFNKVVGYKMYDDVIADCYASKVRETQVCKSTTLLHESRRGSDHTQNTSIWSDQRLTPIM